MIQRAPTVGSIEFHRDHVTHPGFFFVFCTANFLTFIVDATASCWFSKSTGGRSCDCFKCFLVPRTIGPVGRACFVAPTLAFCVFSLFGRVQSYF